MRAITDLYQAGKCMPDFTTHAHRGDHTMEEGLTPTRIQVHFSHTHKHPEQT